jgi:hypothetical protein
MSKYDIDLGIIAHGEVKTLTACTRSLTSSTHFYDTPGNHVTKVLWRKIPPGHKLCILFPQEEGDVAHCGASEARTNYDQKCTAA